MKKEIQKKEVTKLSLVEPIIVHANYKAIWVNMNDKGNLVEQINTFPGTKYYLMSENKIKSLDLGKRDMKFIISTFFSRHLKRNIKILNGTSRELEKIIYSDSPNFTPKKINNIKLSNAMAKYFQEAYNSKNIVNDKKPKFTEHFTLLYKKYPSLFVNSYPKNERKEITDHLLTPIPINIKKEKDMDKNVIINYKIIIDKDKEYLMDKSLFFKKFSAFLSKKAKENKPWPYMFTERFEVGIKKAAMGAICDIQPYIKESEKGQEIVKKIDDDKNRKIALMKHYNIK